MTHARSARLLVYFDYPNNVYQTFFFIIPILVCTHVIQFNGVSASAADPGSEGFDFVGRLGALKAAMETNHRIPEEINETLYYLRHLPRADAAALVRFNPGAHAIVGGIRNIGFRYYIATVVPNGFAAMALDPDTEMEMYYALMPSIFNVTECAYGEACGRLRELIGRTDFAMAAFWKYIIGSSIVDLDFLDRLVRTLAGHPAGAPPIDHGILHDVKIDLRAKPLEVLMGWAHNLRTEFVTAGLEGDVGTYMFIRFWTRLQQEALETDAGLGGARVVHAGPHIP